MADLSYAEQWQIINKAYYDLYGTQALNKISNIIDTQFAGDADAFLKSNIVQVIDDTTGETIGYTYSNIVNSAYGDVANVGGLINSNTAGSTAGAGSATGKVVLDSVKNTAGKTEISTGVRSLATGAKATGNFVFKEVVPSVAAVATGITVGKTFAQNLYNANPNFWNENDMSSLNPQTWETLVSDLPDTGIEGAYKTAFNFLFGLSPDTGNAQAYIDENAFAYLVGYMQSKGTYSSDRTIDFDFSTISTYPGKPATPLPFYFMDVTDRTIHVKWSNTSENRYDSDITYHTTGTKIYLIYYNNLEQTNAYKSAYYFLVSDGDITFDEIKHGSYSASNGSQSGNNSYNNHRYTWYTNYMQYINGHEPQVIFDNNYQNNSMYTYFNSISNYWIWTNYPPLSGYWAYGEALFYGTFIESGGVDGISSQDGATQYTPNDVSYSDLQAVLDALKSQFPDLWNKAVINSQVDPETGVQTDHIYIPVGMPANATNTATDTQPYSDPTAQGNLQSNTEINPETGLNPATENLLKYLIPLLTPPTTDNPVDIGDGETPTVIVPTGSASALYSIYNPSNAELNEFGAWLWSPNFVDQLLKVFNNPMESIIGLHKIFASPVISGAGTIKVGYLDSGVSSNLVGNQYTTIDCGSVNMPEYFGNVLDYAPHTQIHLYLPFIGIVGLNVGDVMRSTISIKYTVDVLSGACLAQVSVQRDANNAVLYTYSGNAAVQYPLSMGSYMGIVNSVVAIAGSVAATVATGGAAAGTIGAATTTLLGAHTNVQHSGSLSGNSGAMGIKTPYLIISRPQSYIANNYQNYMGNPDNFYTPLNACTGYTKVSAVHVDDIADATDTEKTMIETLLKSGVII